MKHFDEIKERKNFARTLGDEELSDCVTYMPSKDTKLPYDIIIDCGETYKYFKHPLCLYVVNGESNDPNTEVIPVTISKNPSVINGTNTLNVTPIINFIRDNEEYLIKLANLEISGPEFFDSYTK